MLILNFSTIKSVLLHAIWRPLLKTSVCLTFCFCAGCRLPAVRARVLFVIKTIVSVKLSGIHAGHKMFPFICSLTWWKPHFSRINNKKDFLKNVSKRGLILNLVLFVIKTIVSVKRSTIHAGHKMFAFFSSLTWWKPHFSRIYNKKDFF